MAADARDDPDAARDRDEGTMGAAVLDWRAANDGGAVPALEDVDGPLVVVVVVALPARTPPDTCSWSWTRCEISSTDSAVAPLVPWLSFCCCCWRSNAARV